MLTYESNWDVIVVGAGAAGLMCAAVAGARGQRVLVLESNAQVGRKILISGGGRCNFTNQTVTPSQYHSSNTHFARSALERYTSGDFIDLVRVHAIAFHEKKLGQLFCDDSARQIVEMLMRECEAGGVAVNCNVKVASVSGDGPYVVSTEQGRYRTTSLVVATGGLSIPKIGATDFGYRLARQYGITVTELRPALVPLTFHESMPKGFTELSGTSVDAEVSYGKQSFRENILFTHWGLSGPAILQISLYWEPGMPININLMPDRDAAAWLLELKEMHPKMTVKGTLKRSLPARFGQAFSAAYCETDSKPLAEMKTKVLTDLGRRLNDWQVIPKGTQGYKKAEVTRGGVSTHELSSKTLEAKAMPGLYFIGEVVDVTGWLGGYNFQWAWASGAAAGQVA
jgi:predicted Rossmann fold flavoprotein